MKVKDSFSITVSSVDIAVSTFADRSSSRQILCSFCEAVLPYCFEFIMLIFNDILISKCPSRAGSRDSSVGIAMATGWTGRFRYPAWQDFSFLHSVQGCSGANPAFYPVGTGAFTPEGKAIGEWSWPFTSTKCRGREWWNYNSTPAYVFMV
jgi:hypothetical protein